MTVRVLVVENEPLIGIHLKEVLEGLGYTVIGPIDRLDRAVVVAKESRFELAVLDVNLNGDSSSPVAHLLQARGIPYVVVTGYGPRALQGFSGAPTLQKPFLREDLARALSRLRTPP